MDKLCIKLTSQQMMPGGIHGLEQMLEIIILYKIPRYVLQGFNFPDDRGHFSIDFGVAREGVHI